ncbi:hypothetical protein GCM10011402_35790 [Paracoccus acridae]|uniref:histidine kinase n=1 Tax=Paracoccus acridae TaxID=1795310 RepID=A0ABQ1VNX6_9RHOB|nr:PAS domain-containing protein [Paracoccus acridae]GGF80023.1 hypothetical protein GCM10011402_35790 [Paracoccus acridae]
MVNSAQPSGLNGAELTDAVLQRRSLGQMHRQIFGSYEVDVQSGLSVWSPTLQRMFPDRSNNPVPMGEIHRSIHPEDRDWVTARMQSAMRSPGPYEFTYRIGLPDGQVLRVRDVGTAHPASMTGQVGRITGTLTDITHEPEGGIGRKLSNDTFWQIIDAAPIGAYAVDSQLRMVRINRTAFATFAEIDNLLGRHIHEILHILWDEPFASEAVARFHQTLETGEPYDADPVIGYRADRKVLEAYDWNIERIELEDGQPGVLCYFYDLTERVRNERVMKEQQQRLSLAYDAARMGAWEVDLLTDEVQGSPQLFALFGAPDFGGDVNDLWRRAIHPDDRPAIKAAFQDAVVSKSAFSVDFRVVLEGGAIRHLATCGEVLCDADGTPVKVIGVDQDITDRKAVELALRESEEQMRTVINHTLAFVSVLDQDGVLRESNQPALDFGGLTKEDVVGRPFWDAHWWTYDPAIREKCRDAVSKARSGQTQRFDVVVRGRKDTFITIDFLLAPVFGATGELRMLVASGFDISDREEARAREKLLMGEINHRTKNILTLVQAVARQTARGSSGDFIPRFETRLMALAKAQDLLFRSATDRVDLRSLAESQLAHFLDRMEARISLAGPPVSLAPHAAQAIGMALHELSTNAGKYGALSSEHGRVEVAWSVQPDHDSFEIVWLERDGPPVVPPTSRGFGSTVINQMTQSALDAEVSLEYRPEGVRWTLICNMSKVTKAE